MNFRDQEAFTGNAAELAALAAECGQGLGLAVDPDKTNERLVRYYVAEGVLDRPDRSGRDATYHYRHLLQLLTARRMAQAGTPLSVIAEHQRLATTRELEDGLGQTLPTPAEMLVSRFMARRSEREARPAKATPSARPPLSLPDVLDEVRQLKAQWAQEMQDVKKASRADDLHLLARRIEETLDTSQAQLLKMSAHLDEAMGRMTEMAHRMQHFQQHVDRMLAQQASHLEELRDRLPPPEPPPPVQDRPEADT